MTLHAVHAYCTIFLCDHYGNVDAPMAFLRVSDTIRKGTCQEIRIGFLGGVPTGGIYRALPLRSRNVLNRIRIALLKAVFTDPSSEVSTALVEGALHTMNP